MIARPSQEERSMASEKSKILIIGGTGYIGKFVVWASVRLDHPTFALVRDLVPANPEKAKLVQGFKDSGVTLVKGDLNDDESLVNAIKAVDVVISTVGPAQVLDQINIIKAIKQVGNIKRFLPSEFGCDVDRVHAVEPAKTYLGRKASIRRSIEAEGIPFTIVSSNYFASCFLPIFGQAPPPTDKVIIVGDGNVKGVFVEENNIGTYTIKAVDDPRTLNKILYLKPPANILTYNELVSLYEEKSGKKFERIYLPEEQLLKQIQESPEQINLILAIKHSVFVKGDLTNFEIEPSFGVDASQLYPDVKYATVEEILSWYFKFKNEQYL